GRADVRATGFSRPEEIAELPKDYSFTAVAADGCTPVRFNPCAPVHYVMNAALAPPGGPADVRASLERIAEATGLTFVDDGTTDEPYGQRRAPYQPDRYGERWAPILIAWGSLGSRGEVQVVGTGRHLVVERAAVSGTLVLNVDAVTDAGTRAPLRDGFGPVAGAGRIGPAGVTWGRVILHELAHIVGLGHASDPAQLMYPETADQTTRPANFAAGDRAGLRWLGRQAGCRESPPLAAGAGPA
ncbi:MAG: matrixin family metalloprotease, partial [Acidimicrobiales bacterium]